MNEVVFLIAVSAFAILYAAGWFFVSLPMDKRRERLSSVRFKVLRAIAALGVLTLRGP